MTSFALLRRRTRQAVLGRRRLLAAAFAAVAVAAALRAVTASPPATTVVLTAARDLPSGSLLRASDLRKTAFIPQSVPAGTLRADQLVGRTTAAPLRSGEPLTDARMVRGSLLDGYPDTVAAPVRIGDADAVRLLRVGDRIDLLAASPERSEAEVVASDVPVVALPKGDGQSNVSGSEGTTGALIIVAVRDETARRLAQSGVSSFISMVIRR
jgi:Flp pilus assembly protein CpaB